MIVNCGSKVRRPASRSLLDALGALQVTHNEEAALRESWVEGRQIFGTCIAADNPNGCRSLFDPLVATYAAHNEEPALRVA